MPYIGSDYGEISDTTTLTNTIKSYYDRMLLETLDPETKFYQFAVKKPLPTGEGTSIIWNRPYRLGFGQKVAAGLKPSANELSTYKVSALIETYGGYVLLEDTVQLTSITDVLNMATEALAKQAAETIDKSIMHAIVKYDNPSVAASASHLIKTSAELLLSTNTFVINTYFNRLIAVSDVRRAAGILRAANVPTVDGQNFVGVIHPLVSEDLRADATWQNWHQYTNPEYLYRGEVGRVDGVRFVESTLTPISAASTYDPNEAASGIQTGLAYGTVIFGRGFFAATELDGGVKTFLVQGAEKQDPLNQTTTYGWKAKFTSKVLNEKCGLVLWTGSGDMLSCASTASAREAGGMNMSAIPTVT